MTVYEKLAAKSLDYQKEDILKQYATATDNEVLFIEQGFEVYKLLYAKFAEEELTELEAKKLLKILTANAEVVKKATRINQKIINTLSKMG